MYEKICLAFSVQTICISTKSNIYFTDLFNSLHSGLYFFFPTVNVMLQLRKSAVPVETLVNSLSALSGVANPRCQPTG